MIKQLCHACGRTTWHNVSGKAENPPRLPRCTFCGHPVKTGLFRPHWEDVRARQIVKVGK